MKLFGKLGAWALITGAAMAVPSTMQAQEIAGKWTAEYPTRIRMVNGVAEGGEVANAILTLEVKGDSVFGTWHAQNTPNPTTPRKVAGTFTGGKLNFAAEPIEVSIRRTDNGESSERPMKVVSFFEGALKEGVLEGTFYSESEDKTMRTSPLNWTAHRATEK